MSFEHMAHQRKPSKTPLVSLDAGKLLGMRQVAQVSTRVADADRAETSKVLSKIGEQQDASRADMSKLLSKIGEVPASPDAVSRAGMSRVLSKIDEPASPNAVSRADMSRLLSKIGAEVPHIAKLAR
jgi:hypothetical protein